MVFSGPNAAFIAGSLVFGLQVLFLVFLAARLRRVNGQLRAYADALEIRNRELEQAREELVLSRQLASVGTLAAGIAHELNNPLTVIMGCTDLLLSRGQTPTPNQKGPEDILIMIRDAARRTKKIVDGFLLFARTKKPEKVSVSIHALLNESIALVRDQVLADHIRIVTHLAPGLPQTNGDPHQLQQVVLNILTNARQAIRSAGRAGTITVTTAQDTDRVRIVLANDGPPIPPEHLGRIFDPLFTTKAPGEGTGLGLAICYGIIKAHGGSIRVAHGLEQGAAFTIELPADQHDCPNGQREKPRAEANSDR
jgi:signal transduction histidine kinase